MAISGKYYKSAVFITGTRDADSAEEPTLRGTGFVVVINSDVPNRGFTYIVTAAHVVRPLASTFIKVVKRDGSITDFEVDEWLYHPTEDIAVTGLRNAGEYQVSYVKAGNFVGTAKRKYQPGPGDKVFFAGLLGQVPSMGAQNVPMVRSGTIGALHQEGIPMRLPGNTVINVQGHLIDCQSFGGFSGSPCFVTYLSSVEKTESMGLPYPVESTLLLGMVGGHFDLQASVTMPDQENKIDVPVAAGVVVLYPAETIRETLDLERLAVERAEVNAELKARR